MGWWKRTDTSTGSAPTAVLARRLLPMLLVVVVFANAAPPALRVGLYENSPKIGTGTNGQPEGIFVDILAAIAEREHWQLEYVPGTWQQGLDRLTRGELDIMPDVAHSAARADIYTFPREPVLVSWSQVYARRDADIRSLIDLQGRRIATLAGSIQHDEIAWLLKSFHLNAALTTQPGFADAFAAVRDGHADAAVTNRFFGRRHASAYGLADTGIVFSPAELHFAMAPDSDPTIRNAIDHHLRELKQDPHSAYYRSLHHWTLEDIKWRLPVWLWWVAGGMIALLLLGMGWITTLHRHARRLQTADALQRRLLLELANARDSAIVADQTKSAFIATMSHELRTPLTSIMGFTDLLLQGCSGPLTDKQRQQLNTVSASANHLFALVSDSLDMARIGANQLQLTHETIDIEASTKKIAEIMQPLADARKLRLEVNIRQPLPNPVKGDTRRLEQVMLNLLGNAIKFTASGSVSLLAEICNDNTGRPMLCIRISDTGPGIRPEDLPRLFTPFNQLATTAAQSSEGTGLGLAICKSLIEMMGGHITVNSRIGAGSTFTLLLPISDQSTTPPRPGR